MPRVICVAMLLITAGSTFAQSRTGTAAPDRRNELVQLAQRRFAAFFEGDKTAYEQLPASRWRISAGSLESPARPATRSDDSLARTPLCNRCTKVRWDAGPRRAPCLALDDGNGRGARPKSVTYVSGTICHLCLRAGPRLRGGGGGIRTPETLSGLTVFKTAAFNHSATPPNKL
jgi:hypothetical protein